MLDFIAMCTLVMFLFLLVLGFVFGLVQASWRLFIVALCGVISMWAILCTGRRR